MTKQDISVLGITSTEQVHIPPWGKRESSTQECHQMGYVSSMEGTVTTRYRCCDSWPKSCKATASISILAATFYIATSLRRRSGAETGGKQWAWECMRVFFKGICQWIYIKFKHPQLRSICLSFHFVMVLCHKFRCHFRLQFAQVVVVPSRLPGQEFESLRATFLETLWPIEGPRWVDQPVFFEPSNGVWKMCWPSWLIGFFSLWFFLGKMAILLPCFAKMLCIWFIYIHICFYLWLFLCNVSTFFTRHCKYEYDVSNFWTYPEKIFWKSLIWGLENVFLKTWTWIFRGSPDRRFGIEESGQAKAGLRMGVETRLAITSFVQKNMVQSLLNLVPFLNNHVLMVLNHWMMNQVFT